MAAELLQNLEAPGQEAALREVKAGSPQVLKNWLVNAYLDFEVTDEKVAQLLLNALNSEDEELAGSAHLALEHCSTGFPSGPAVAGLHDPHPITRQVCLNLLGKLDKRPPFDVLLPLLHDPDADVRRTAEEALMNCHQWTDDPRSQQLLMKILASPKDKHRLQAAESLGYYKTQESVRALALALKDPDRFVSATAGYSLRRIGGDQAVNAIIDILDDLPPDRRASAEAFADQISGGGFKTSLYWQNHETTKQSN
jgi:HEAT repeat protein